MLAGADGHMPKSLLVEADQQFFQDTLDQAAVLVQGRHSHEGSPRAAARRRLVLTRHIAGIAEDTTYPNALLWNPNGATLQQAWDRLGAPDGMLAVIGGTAVYDLFLSAENRVISDVFSARGSIPGLGDGTLAQTWVYSDFDALIVVAPPAVEQVQFANVGTHSAAVADTR